MMQPFRSEWNEKYNSLPLVGAELIPNISCYPYVMSSYNFDHNNIITSLVIRHSDKNTSYAISYEIGTFFVINFL